MRTRLMVCAATAVLSACTQSAVSDADRTLETAATLQIGQPSTPSTPCMVHGTVWSLRDSSSPGAADATFVYGFPNGIPLLGDWDGDGVATPGMYDPAGQGWYLRNSNTYGVANVTFTYGFPGGLPVVGDWDGDGLDTIGMYDPARQGWYLRNSNTQGAADWTFQYGFPGGVPVVGDWDANGTHTVGMYDPAGQRWYLRNSNTYGIADTTFQYGFPGGLPVVGDWDGDGTDTVGMYDPTAQGWYLRNRNSYGVADHTFTYGSAGDSPLAGHIVNPRSYLVPNQGGGDGTLLGTSCTGANMARRNPGAGWLIRHPRIHALFWGAYWQQPSTWSAETSKYEKYIETMYSDPVIWDRLGEYGIGQGTYAGATFLTPALTNLAQATEADLRTELQNEIVQGLVPHTDENDLYVVLLPQGSVAGSGDGHNMTQVAGQDIWYALINWDGRDWAQEAHIDHEIFEAATDPDTKTGWRAIGSGDEVGDPCSVATQYGGFTIARYWSQLACRCVAPGDPPPATCNSLPQAQRLCCQKPWLPVCHPGSP